jgi:hypothetical protein
VLATSMVESALRDPPQACPAGQVQKDHRVRRLEPDRQAGRVVPVDDPSRSGYQARTAPCPAASSPGRSRGRPGGRG